MDNELDTILTQDTAFVTGELILRGIQFQQKVIKKALELLDGDSTELISSDNAPCENVFDTGQELDSLGRGLLSGIFLVNKLALLLAKLPIKNIIHSLGIVISYQSNIDLGVIKENLTDIPNENIPQLEQSNMIIEEENNSYVPTNKLVLVGALLILDSINRI